MCFKERKNFSPLNVQGHYQPATLTRTQALAVPINCSHKALCRVYWEGWQCNLSAVPQNVSDDKVKDVPPGYVDVSITSLDLGRACGAHLKSQHSGGRGR